MKNILYEIKNFRRLANLKEDVDSSVKVVLIGDSLIDYLENDDLEQYNLDNSPWSLLNHFYYTCQISLLLFSFH